VNLDLQPASASALTGNPAREKHDAPESQGSIRRYRDIRLNDMKITTSTTPPRGAAPRPAGWCSSSSI